MKNYLKNLFKSSEPVALPPLTPVRKSLKDIVAGFQSTITDLQDLTSDNVVRLNQKLAQAEALRLDADVLSTEATAADKIATNLQALLK